MPSTILPGALGATVLIALATAAPAQGTPPAERSPAAGHGVHPAQAGTKIYKVGAITIEAPWARATPGGAQVAAGYMRISNGGAQSDRLVGGTMPLSGRFQVHEMSSADQVMRMRELEGGLEIKPGTSVELRPGSYHIMFLDLKEPLKEGQILKGTLVFEKAGAVEVEYAVRPLAARGEGTEHRH